VEVEAFWGAIAAELAVLAGPSSDHDDTVVFECSSLGSTTKIYPPLTCFKGGRGVLRIVIVES